MNYTTEEYQQYELELEQLIASEGQQRPTDKFVEIYCERCGYAQENNPQGYDGHSDDGFEYSCWGWALDPESCEDGETQADNTNINEWLEEILD